MHEKSTREVVLATSIEERFWSKVRKTNGCWLWIAGHCSAGYGVFKFDGRHRNAHIIAWEWQNGPVPHGKELHHTCRNKACVRPDHVVALTHREHVIVEGTNAAAINALKTHCKRGHLFDDANTCVAWRGSHLTRQCRACRRESMREHRKRVRLSKPQPTTEERFWAKVDRSGECWLWEGRTEHGYGRASFNGHLRLAHIVAWTLEHGALAAGLYVIHTCANRLCVRPSHLVAQTRSEYCAARLVTHCLRGHAFTPENTHYEKRRSGNVVRRCRLCRASMGRASRKAS